MRTHTQSAHWHAQETVAQTLLAAAHATRRAAQGHLIHVRWPTRRQRAATASWGAALLAPWVGWRGIHVRRSHSSGKGHSYLYIWAGNDGVVYTAHQSRLCCRPVEGHRWAGSEVVRGERVLGKLQA